MAQVPGLAMRRDGGCPLASRAPIWQSCSTTPVQLDANRLPQDTDPPAIGRKAPHQARAKETVAAILEAAARLLERKGEAAVTTGAVARLAGCSIGSLYQYFASRDEILLALANRERQRLLAKARELMSGLGPGPHPVETRAFVRVLVASFAARRGARRQFELVMTCDARTGQPNVTGFFADALARRAGADADADEEAARRANRARAFVMTRAMVGVLRAAALEEDDIIGDPAFEDALCLLVETLRPSI